MNQPAMTAHVNDNLVLLVGKAATGKSAALMGLENPEGVVYLNCENGKKLPFASKFQEHTVLDPLQVPKAFQNVEEMPGVHTVVLDSLTYLMDMYETMYVYNSTNSMKAWGDFAQYFKTLMQTHVAASSKNVIFTAHTKDTLNEAEMVMETAVPIKGALKNNGVESYFSCIIASKKVPLKLLAPYQSPLLGITDEEEALGFKYVFQTRLTKDTVNERLRGPMGLWSTGETFIDNNAQLVIDRLRQYYS